MSRYITESDKEKINQINILDWMRDQGYELTKVGKGWRIKGWNGLNIADNGEVWKDFSSDQGGRITSLCQWLKEKTWFEAMDELRDYLHGKGGIINTEEKSKVGVTKKVEIRKEQRLKKTPFVLPPRGNNAHRVFAYLIKTRKIEKVIIQELVKAKKLYQNDKGSCVFLGIDEKAVPKSAFVKSTNTIGKSFQQIVEGSDINYPFSMKGGIENKEKVRVFESIIDLLSYMSFERIGKILHSGHYLAMNGLKGSVIEEYIKRNPEIKTIILCVDNDEYGEKFRKSCKEDQRFKNYLIVDEKSKMKDWNEDLINNKGAIE